MSRGPARIATKATIAAPRFTRRRWKGSPLVVRPTAEDPIAERLAPLADPAFVRTLLADEPIRVRNGNAAALLTGATAGETIDTTYGAFFDQLVADPGLELVCSELATVAPLQGPAAVPAFARPGPGERGHAEDQDTDRTTDMFLAGPAAVAHLHYDGDLRDVVMLQLFGHKRYVLIDPAHSAKVLPLTGAGVQRTSGVFLEHMGDDDLQAFLRYTDAHVCTLGPGDLLYMPAGWWHYVEYLDVSLSVNHRLGRLPELRTLAEQVPVPSVEWLVLAQCFRDPDRTARTPALRAAWKQVERVLAEAEALLGVDPAARAAILERFCLELCAELGEPIAGAPATMVDLDRRARLTAPPEPVTAGPPGPTEPNEDQPMSAPTAGTTDDARSAGPASDPGRWTVATRVQVPSGSSLLVPVQSPGLALAQGDRLVAMLPPDPVHHWTLPVLTRIARQPGVTVEQLATDSAVPAAHVLAFLNQMATVGWVDEAR
jgi:hypothetical protein